MTKKKKKIVLEIKEVKISGPEKSAIDVLKDPPKLDIFKPLTEKEWKKYKKEHPLPSPEEIRQKMEEIRREHLERAKQERIDKFTERRTGVCVVCKGKIVGKITEELCDPGHVRIGGHNATYPKHHGFWCEGCGLKYQFLAQEIIQKPKTGK